ncbi:MAG: hypothetical protein J6W62_01840, partial [Spirochaetia bacterium]|nr:hypothetical protein [Spirochaetia bacterium]
PIMAGETESVILVFADQLLPEEYNAVAGPEDKIPPYAAAFVLSSKQMGKSVPIQLYPEAADISQAVPYASLKELIQALKPEASCV